MKLKLILSTIKLYASMYNVDPNLVSAIIKVESNFNHNAIGTKGEVGLMQIRPEHTDKNIWDMRENIKEGIRILAKAKKYCRHFKDHTYLVCYNAGITGGSKITYPKKFSYYQKVMKEYAPYKIY